MSVYTIDAADDLDLVFGQVAKGVGFMTWNDLGDLTVTNINSRHSSDIWLIGRFY